MDDSNHIGFYTEEERLAYEIIIAALTNLPKEIEIKRVNFQDLKNFFSISKKIDFKKVKTWKIFNKPNSFYLCFSNFTNIYVSKFKYKEDQNYIFGILDLKKDFGEVLICPETLSNKIFELFNPIELDFESHPKFSKRFYTLAKNKEHFKNTIPIEFLNYLETLKDFEIEFSGKKCVFRMSGLVDNKEINQLCSIGIMLDKILNYNH